MPEPVGQAELQALVAVGRVAAVPEGVGPVVAAAVAAVALAAVVVADRAAPAAISDPTPVARGVTD